MQLLLMIKYVTKTLDEIVQCLKKQKLIMISRQFFPKITKRQLAFDKVKEEGLCKNEFAKQTKIISKCRKVKAKNNL